MATKKMAAARAAVVKKIRQEQPQTFKKPAPPIRTPKLSNTERRLQTLENRLGAVENGSGQ